MKITMICPPFLYNETEWITVPPQRYGGIQWIIKNLMDGLSQLGQEIILIGAPGSPNSKCVTSLDVGSPSEISAYLRNHGTETIVHDHSCRGIEFSEKIDFSRCRKVIHSHYLTSRPRYHNNVVAASHAHAVSIGFPQAPVVRHPVNPDNYIYSNKKGDYLLFMGRVSPWKGTFQAAHFASLIGMKLAIVGPAWERDYFDMILEKYGSNIEYCGEMGGDEKKKMLANATATLVFSGGTHTPTGLPWIEPGSQIVSESGISGTPVISTKNGCLQEIVPQIGCAINDVETLTAKDAEQILDSLPNSEAVREISNREWNYIKIAKEYLSLYERVGQGKSW